MGRKGAGEKEGVPARRIFPKAGYDVNILGTSRIKNLSKRIPKEASSPCGLHEGYHIHSKRPEDADYSRMAPDEAMAAMQRDFELILEAYRHRGYQKGARSIYMSLLHRNHPVVMNVKKARRLMDKYVPGQCPAGKLLRPYERRNRHFRVPDI